MCNDKIIKELLPAYIEQCLDQPETLRVDSHLASCEDCRIELSHLRILSEEAVPDPGEAFWAAMPVRVYQAVQKQKAEQKTFAFARLLHWMALPRWTWTAASVATVLLLSLFVIRPVQKGPEMASSPEFELVDENLPSEPMNMNELDNEALSAIDIWAGAEIASISRESEQVLDNAQDSDVYEDLLELNAQQTEQLMKMIDQRMKEGYT